MLQSSFLQAERRPQPPLLPTKHTVQRSLNFAFQAPGLHWACNTLHWPPWAQNACESNPEVNWKLQAQTSCFWLLPSRHSEACRGNGTGCGPRETWKQPLEASTKALYLARCIRWWPTRGSRYSLRNAGLRYTGLYGSREKTKEKTLCFEVCLNQQHSQTAIFKSECRPASHETKCNNDRPSGLELCSYGHAPEHKNWSWP